MSFVITIGRQYGSGGRFIGKKLAELLGVNFYDNELITTAATQSGLSKAVLDNYDEKKDGFFTGGEHKDNHAQLRHLVDEGGLLEKPQKCGAEYQSGHQRAHHLGHGEALGDDAEELGADENERQIQKEMIGFHAEEHLDSKNGAAGPPPGKGNSQGRKEA